MLSVPQWTSSGQQCSCHTRVHVCSHCQMQVFLIDPPGSSLASFVDSHGADMTANPGSTMVEGIGINRITKNFACANVNQSFRGTDQEALDMAYYLLRYASVTAIDAMSHNTLRFRLP